MFPHTSTLRMAPLIACAAKLIPSRKTQRSHSLARPSSFFCHLRKISLAKTRKSRNVTFEAKRPTFWRIERFVCVGPSGSSGLAPKREMHFCSMKVHLPRTGWPLLSSQLAAWFLPRDKKTRMYWIISTASSNATNATHELCAWHTQKWGWIKTNYYRHRQIDP